MPGVGQSHLAGQRTAGISDWYVIGARRFDYGNAETGNSDTEKFGTAPAAPGYGITPSRELGRKGGRGVVLLCDWKIGRSSEL